MGNKVSGFSLAETKEGDFLLAGNQSVFYLDSIGYAKWKASYSFMLDGVGSVMNNVVRAKELRDGTLMVAGQAYEGNCWTNFKSSITMTGGRRSREVEPELHGTQPADRVATISSMTLPS